MPVFSDSRTTSIAPQWTPQPRPLAPGASRCAARPTAVATLRVCAARYSTIQQYNNTGQYNTRHYTKALCWQDSCCGRATCRATCSGALECCPQGDTCQKECCKGGCCQKTGCCWSFINILDFIHSTTQDNPNHHDTFSIQFVKCKCRLYQCTMHWKYSF